LCVMERMAWRMPSRPWTSARCSSSSSSSISRAPGPLTTRSSDRSPAPSSSSTRAPSPASHAPPRTTPHHPLSHVQPRTPARSPRIPTRLPDRQPPESQSRPIIFRRFSRITLALPSRLLLHPFHICALVLTMHRLPIQRRALAPPSPKPKSCYAPSALCRSLLLLIMRLMRSILPRSPASRGFARSRTRKHGWRRCQPERLAAHAPEPVILPVLIVSGRGSGAGSTADHIPSPSLRSRLPSASRKSKMREQGIAHRSVQRRDVASGM
jgi:hypothetical protein